MDTALLQRLEKILALADSSHEGEALLALRKAQGLLKEAGYSLRDLAGLAFRRKGILSFRSAAAPKDQVGEFLADRQTRDAELAAFRQRIGELETQLIASRYESQRWHRLAKDSVDTLWKWATPSETGSKPPQWR